MKTMILRVRAILILIMLSLPATICLGEENLPALIKRVEPSIIVLLTYNKEGRSLGQGTGFFITKDGDAVTNYHVLKGASRAEAKTSDGKVYPVKKVVAEDEEGDLIRVSIDIPKEVVHPLSVHPSFPEVGERIVVMGTPWDLKKRSLTASFRRSERYQSSGRLFRLQHPSHQVPVGAPLLI